MVKEYKRIAAFGASTANGVGDDKKGGFLYCLGDFLGVEVLNWGVPGENTHDMVSRLAELKIPEETLVIITLGINDILQSSTPTSMDNYREDVSTLLDYFKETGPVFYMSQFPVDYEKLGLDEALVESYVMAGLDLAVKREIPCLDIKEHLDPFGGWKDFLAEDGLHFNSMGHEFLAALIRDRI